MGISERDADKIEDAGAAAVEAALSAIPFIGGPLAVMANRAFGSALLRRHEALIEEIRDDLDRALNLGLVTDPIEALSNDLFLAGLSRVFRESEETANSDKRRLLRNVLINGLDPMRVADGREAELFNRLISRYDPEHVAVLAAALRAAPNAQGSASVTDRQGVKIELFGLPSAWRHSEEENERRIDVDVRATELIGDGLISEKNSSEIKEAFGRSLDRAKTSQEISTRSRLTVTARGRRFLRLVEDPFERG
ncbi:MAG: hypothetical protein ABIP33_07820 [Pseudolysinimonas sp.]